MNYRKNITLRYRNPLRLGGFTTSIDFDTFLATEKKKKAKRQLLEDC